MMELKEMTLTSFLYKAKEIAQKRNVQQLVSWTRQIQAISLLDAFAAVEETEEDRLFWSDSSQDFMLLGIGSAQKITATEDRFKTLEKTWNTLVQEAMIHNPFREKGTGLIAFGGMTFDPLREKGDLWRRFPPSQLTIPKYVIVFEQGNYFLTVNQFVNGQTDVSDLMLEIDVMEEMLLQAKPRQKQLTQRIVKKTEIAPETWKKSVQKAVEEIQAARAEKIVLARELRLELRQSPNISQLLEKLLDSQPNSYVFAYEQDDNCFIGATPERLVRVEGKSLLSTCLAGTAPRGATPEKDAQLAQALLDDKKNRQEHNHVVQMIKTNIDKYCENIHIPRNPVIYPLRNLQHLYTPVTATLKQEYSVFNVIEALHPTPALGGVPRHKALQFIREEELLDRGWYGAPIGWLDSGGNSEFAVAIRSGLLQANEVSLFAGCGVMGDSDPEMEYEETNVKFLPMLTILEEENESH